jgi:hypothetical protein
MYLSQWGLGEYIPDKDLPPGATFDPVPVWASNALNRFKYGASGTRLDDIDGAGFLGAVEAGYVPHTARGLETFVAYRMGALPTAKTMPGVAPDSTLDKFGKWLGAYNVMRVEIGNQVARGETLTPRLLADPAAGLMPIRWDKNVPLGADLGAAVNKRVQEKLGILGPLFLWTGPTVKSPTSSALIPQAWVISDTVDPVTGSRVLKYRDPQRGEITLTGPATAAPPPPPERTLVEFIVSKDPKSGYGASGDGIHFPVVLYRVNVESPPASGRYKSVGKWIRWDGVVNRTSSATTKVAFLEDVLEEIKRSLGNNDPRPAAYYDWPNFQGALGAPKGPPPPTGTVDVLASSSSTSYQPVTLAPGALPEKPPVILPPVPSGTEPPPSTKPWTDVMAPPPPGPTILPPPPAAITQPVPAQPPAPMGPVLQLAPGPAAGDGDQVVSSPRAALPTVTQWAKVALGAAVVGGVLWAVAGTTRRRRR